MDTNDPLVWERPGAGTWTLDVDHETGPRSLLAMEIFAGCFSEGFRTLFARYGMPLSHLEAGFVNRRTYTCPKVFGAPDKDGGPPPVLVLKVLSRVVPKLRRRFAVAEEALAEQRWLRDAERWEAERPSWVERFDTLAAVDPTGLADEDLADHVSRALGALREGILAHFEHNGPYFGVGLFLSAVAEQGVDVVEAAAALRGASPGSGADAVRSLLAVRDAMVEAGIDPAGARTYDDVRAASPRAAELLDAHLRRYGLQALGADVGTPLALDSEAMLVRSIADGVEVPDPDAGLNALEDVLASVRDEHRAELRQLGMDARRCYRTTDDQSSVLAAWPVGICTLACREAARRLTAAGRFPDVDAILDVSAAELDALLRSTGGPDPEELRARGEQRARIATSPAPRVLGPPAPEPPPSRAFPPAAARLVEAIGAVIAAKLATPEAAREERGVLWGDGIGEGVVTARAVVSRELDDVVARIEPGDVLITGVTNPGFNTVLMMVGGLVTEAGGQLSHPAVVSRELGIPAVLGIPDATERIPDGARVEVDAGRGTIRVLDEN